MLWFNFILGINLIFLCFKPLSYITNIPTQRKIKLNQNWTTTYPWLTYPVSKLSGALWRRGVKRKDSLQLCLWNLNSASNSPVASRRRSTELSDFRQSARSGNERECKQTSKNTCQGWWLHYYLRQSAFRIVIASFRPAARAPQRACSQATADMVSMFIISSSCKCKEETLLFSVACIVTMRLLDSLRKKKRKEFPCMSDTFSRFLKLTGERCHQVLICFTDRYFTKKSYKLERSKKANWTVWFIYTRWALLNHSQCRLPADFLFLQS